MYIKIERKHKQLAKRYIHTKEKQQTKRMEEKKTENIDGVREGKNTYQFRMVISNVNLFCEAS